MESVKIHVKIVKGLDYASIINKNIHVIFVNYPIANIINQEVLVKIVAVVSIVLMVVKNIHAKNAKGVEFVNMG